jgi:membrane-associated phospholipid phosphatase
VNSVRHNTKPPSRLPHFGVAAALVLFALLATAVYWDGRPYFSWDLSVSRAVQSAPWPAGFETLMRSVSLPGDDVFGAGVLVLAACGGLLLCRARRAAVVLAAVVAAGFAIKASIKLGIGRPRPTAEVVNVISHPSDYSFPSGHTVYYVVFLGFLWFLTFALVRPRLLRWLLLTVLGALVLLVGLSRVYLGAHWASDVVGGYLLGGALLTTAVSGYRRWSRRVMAAVEGPSLTFPAPIVAISPGGSNGSQQPRMVSPHRHPDPVAAL